MGEGEGGNALLNSWLTFRHRCQTTWAHIAVNGLSENSKQKDKLMFFEANIKPHDIVIYTDGIVNGASCLNGYLLSSKAGELLRITATLVKSSSPVWLHNYYNNNSGFILRLPGVLDAHESV